MKRKAKSPFQPGVNVKIIKPHFFIRCGYPLTFDMEVESVLKTHDTAIREFVLKQVKPNLNLDVDEHLKQRMLDDYADARCVLKIAKAIAYESLKAKRFGGSKRTIYTKEYADMAGKVAKVQSKFYCLTGVYNSAYRSSYDGEYEPAYLGDQANNEILDLSWFASDSMRLVSQVHHVMIESANVEITTEPDTNEWLGNYELEATGGNHGEA